MRTGEHQFTAAQYESLGRLIHRWAVPANRYQFEVHKELAGSALLCIVCDSSGSEPVRLCHGIEPDGYIHT
jgi:hypothetical protein